MTCEVEQVKQISFYSEVCPVAPMQVNMKQTLGLGTGEEFEVRGKIVGKIEDELEEEQGSGYDKKETRLYEILN